MKKMVDDKVVPYLEYYDGDTLDLLKENHNVLDLDNLISYSSYYLNNFAGFIPNFTYTFDGKIYDEYWTPEIIVTNTLKNGSKEKFDKWIEEIKREKSEQEVKAPMKEKKI